MHMQSTSRRPGTPRARPRFNPDALVRARLAKGWKQDDLAQACAEAGDTRVSQADISRYEKGYVQPRPARLLAIATALDIKVGDLLADTAEDAQATGT